MTSSATYYYTKAMTDLFVNLPGGSGISFSSVGSVNDVWTVSFNGFSYTDVNKNKGLGVFTYISRPIIT